MDDLFSGTVRRVATYTARSSSRESGIYEPLGIHAIWRSGLLEPESGSRLRDFVCIFQMRQRAKDGVEDAVEVFAEIDG